MNLQELSQSEKILLAEDLWDSVAVEEHLFPVTDEQKKELDIRLAKYSNHSEVGDTWENVRNRISNS